METSLEERLFLDGDWEDFVRRELFINLENCEKTEVHKNGGCESIKAATKILKAYLSEGENKALEVGKRYYKEEEHIKRILEYIKRNNIAEIYVSDVELMKIIHDNRLDHGKLTNEDWLKIRSINDIKVPDPSTDMLEYLIGQDQVKEVMEIIAYSGKFRNIEMLGPPGTGKSLAAEGLSQLLYKINPIREYKYNYELAKKFQFLEVPRKGRKFEKVSGARLHIFYEKYIMPRLLKILPRGVCDVLAYYNFDNPARPFIRILPPGWGKKFEDEVRNREAFSSDVKNYSIDMGFSTVYSIIGYYIANYILTGGSPLTWIMTLSAIGFLLFIHIFIKFRGMAGIIAYGPKGDLELRKRTPFVLVNNESLKVPFTMVDEGTATQLLGYTQHDPFGGMGRLEHESLLPGKIHEANGGVLYVDEAETVFTPKATDYSSIVYGIRSAMEDGVYPISHHQTGQHGGTMSHVSTFNKLPTKFMLITAGNAPIADRAIRNRIFARGYQIYVNSYIPDTPEGRRAVLIFIKQWMEIENSRRNEQYLNMDISAMKEILNIAKKLSLKSGALTALFRTLGAYITKAEDIARAEGSNIIKRKHVLIAWKRYVPMELEEVKRNLEIFKPYKVYFKEGFKIGIVNGLSVYTTEGYPVGIGYLLPVEAIVIYNKSGEKNELSVQKKLGDIAIDAAENIRFLFEKITGIENYKIRINYLQTYSGIEGDSASVAMLAALLSSYANIPVDQSIAVTGSLGLNGQILPVGGIPAKIEAAIEYGMKKVIVPEKNRGDVPDGCKGMIEIIYAKTLSDYLIYSGLLKFDENNEIHRTIRDRILELYNGGER